MKFFFACLALLFGPWLWPRAVAADGDVVRVLVLTVGPEDEAAARLLEDLGHVSATSERSAQASDARVAQAALARTDAVRAVVLDTQQRAVRVIERDGSVRTRLIEGAATPYTVAFVASELLSLEARAPAPPSSVPPAAPQEPPMFARVDAALSFDAARAYTTAWVMRPKLALGIWLRPRPAARVWPLLGLELAGPARLRRSVGEAGRVTAWRWDSALRAGAVFALGPVRALTFARGQLAVQRAEFSGGLDSARSISLGLGGGVLFELGLTSWLGVCAGAELGAQLRRNQLTLHGEPALRESMLWISASLGLVLSTPERPR